MHVDHEETYVHFLVQKDHIYYEDICSLDALKKHSGQTIWHE